MKAAPLIILTLLLTACSGAETISLNIEQRPVQQIETVQIKEKEQLNLNLSPKFIIVKEFGKRDPSSINGTIKNVGNRTGSLNITAKIYYAGLIVSANTKTIEDVKVGEEVSFGIPFGREKLWDGYVLVIDSTR